MDIDYRQYVKKAYVGLGNIADMQGDFSRAALNFERGLAYADAPAGRSEILQLIAQVYIDLSRYADASALVVKARQALRPLRQRPGPDYWRALAGILNLKSWIYRHKGDTLRALREAKTGLKILAPYTVNPDVLNERSKLLNTLGGIYYLIGDRQALRYYRRVLKIEKRLGNIRAVATVKNNMGNAYSAFGNFKKAIALNREYLKISERIGDLDGIATAAEAVGCMYYSLDDHHRALEYLHRSYQISKKMGSDLGVSYTSNNLGIVYLGIGEAKKALEFFRRDLSIAKRNGEKRTQARALYNIGSAWLKKGDYEKARQALEPAVRMLEQIKDRVRLQNALHRLAVALASKKQSRRRALSLIRRSARLARMAPPRLEIAAVHSSQGKIMGLMGKAAKVKFYFERALEIYRQDELSRLEADALMDYGLTLMSMPRNRQPDTDFIRRLFNRARAIYLRLRIDRKLEEAERLIRKLR